MARVVVVNVAELALEGPFEGLWSCTLSVVILGIEFVVAFRAPMPG